MVSGYAVIGVGAFTGLANVLTDFFGGESEDYLNKIRQAERRAINVAKMQAIEMGANVISGIRLEVKSGSTGLLLVSCVGTASNTASVNMPDFAKMRELSVEYHKLKAERLPIVAGTSESYSELAPPRTKSSISPLSLGRYPINPAPLPHPEAGLFFVGKAGREERQERQKRQKRQERHAGEIIPPAPP